MKQRKVKSKNTHVTEQNYPKQCAEFERVVNSLYSLHLDKNKEYTCRNIQALGMLGCALRIHEKSVRLLTLLGWDTTTGQPTKPLKDIKLNSAESELMDIANLAIISTIVKKDKWAK